MRNELLVHKRRSNTCQWVLSILLLATLAVAIVGIFFPKNTSSGSQTLENDVAMLKAEVLDIQICKNSTGDGLSITSDEFHSPEFSCTSTSCVLSFSEVNEMWDDANFFTESAFPDRIYLPRDGRYIVAAIFNTRVTENIEAEENLVYTHSIEQIGTTGPVCKTTQYVQPLYYYLQLYRATKAVYCEYNYLQTNSSYLQVSFSRPQTSQDDVYTQAQLFIREIK